MKTLRQKLETLPASRRKKIARKTEYLIAEEMTKRTSCNTSLTDCIAEGGGFSAR
jgi:hypothetical protein